MNRQSYYQPAPNPYSKRQPAHDGYRSDLGLYMRSSWEANYARMLNFLKDRGDIHRWQYEPDVFIFRGVAKGTRAYVPDFKIWNLQDDQPYYVEIKGFMDAKSKLKLKRMKLYYPEVELQVVEADEYQEIDRMMRGSIPHW